MKNMQFYFTQDELVLLLVLVCLDHTRATVPHERDALFTLFHKICEQAGIDMNARKEFLSKLKGIDRMFQK